MPGHGSETGSQRFTLWLAWITRPLPPGRCPARPGG